MRYVSTRGSAPILPFDDVLLTGLARDGGLYVPERWPRLRAEDLAGLRGRPYADVALAVMTPFVGRTIATDRLREILVETYAGFDHAAVAPLKQLDAGSWLMELFHGPTIAFKDYALQFLGRLFDEVLAARGERLTVVGATSGDTGSAAIEACRDRQAVDIFILYPHGRTSEVQRRQMTTVAAANVHTIAVEGSFDDCQDLVKAMFNDIAYRDRMRLSAVNSINWVRIMAQIVYYVAAGIALGAPDRRLAFAVPTGNFGNIYAAYAARSMGLPVERLIVGSNRNDILDRFFRTGAMEIAAVEPSLSPSMDIQVSSNFERLLFDLFDRDGRQVADTLTRFRKSGMFAVTDNQLGHARGLFASHRLGDDETLATIGATFGRTGELVDPHTAVGLAALAANRPGDPDVACVSLACAHPAKFPEAVERATGHRPPLPDKLADLFDRPERFDVLPANLAAVQRYIAERARITATPERSAAG